MTQNNPFADMPVIFAYTRAAAIGDGVLIDLTEPIWTESDEIVDVSEVTRQHFSLPVACTSTVWTLIERTVAEHPHQDFNGIVHDLLGLGRLAAGANRDRSAVIFPCIVGQRERTFKLVIGPGDEGEPVMTLMMSDED